MDYDDPLSTQTEFCGDRQIFHFWNRTKGITTDILRLNPATEHQTLRVRSPSLRELRQLLTRSLRVILRRRRLGASARRRSINLTVGLTEKSQSREQKRFDMLGALVSRETDQGKRRTMGRGDTLVMFASEQLAFGQL